MRHHYHHLWLQAQIIFKSDQKQRLIIVSIENLSISLFQVWQTAIKINKAIENLEDEFKVPFRMHTEGFKYKEIADKLDLKIGTVKSRIFFTRKKLMDSLKDYAA